jgi:endonuclease/exonuclease/phosphatase family metal-dependent hydrolase
VNRTLFALLASLVVASAVSQSTEPTRIRIATWNLEWFPNGSAKEASAEQQNQRIKEAADVLRPINPDIILLQEVRDYDAFARLGEAIAPGIIKSPFALRSGNYSIAA